MQDPILSPEASPFPSLPVWLISLSKAALYNQSEERWLRWGMNGANRCSLNQISGLRQILSEIDNERATEEVQPTHKPCF